MMDKLEEFNKFYNFMFKEIIIYSGLFFLTSCMPAPISPIKIEEIKIESTPNYSIQEDLNNIKKHEKLNTINDQVLDNNKINI